MKNTLQTMLRATSAGALLITGCGRHTATTPGPGETLPAISVRVAAVEARTDSTTEEVTGTVRAKLHATVESKISGSISQMLATPGRRFAAGELLAELDAREIKARLDQAMASRDQAERDAMRFRKLFDQQAVTRAETEAVESRLRIAEGSVVEAETMLGYVRITAPFAGVVTRKLADVGDLAMPGRPVAEMEDPALLRLETNLPETFMGGLTIGRKLQILIGGSELEGTVSEIAPAADPASRTFLVKLDLPHADNLRSGQFGRVRVPVAEGASLRAPASAVTQRGQLELVYIVADGKAQLRLVKTGRHSGDAVELLSGVATGEQLIVAPPSSLRDGQPVLVQP